MTNTDSKSLIKFNDNEKLLEIASLIFSIVPWVGGPVSNVLGGIATKRKINRAYELLENFAIELKNHHSEESEQYVKTEDFEDLLEQTLRRTSEERNEEKRKVLKSFLVDAVHNPGEQYDDQLRFLKLVEEIYGDHIQLLKALSMPPGSVTNQFSGSVIQTLSERLPGMKEERIEDLVTHLNDLRVTNIRSLKAMMTAAGAQNLQGLLTPLGNRFLKYLLNENTSE